MHLPALIQDLAVILGVAAFVTFLFRRIKQPVVLGYVVAGVIVGPHTPNFFSVSDVPSIKVWAELGVIFLMFALGLEFSFRRLARVGMSAVVTGLIQIVVMVIWGLVIAKMLGWTRMDAAFLGCMIAISSTTIIIKALEELGLKQKRFAELVFGILIVEDLAAILMLVALTNVATTAEVGGLELLLAGGKLAVVVGIWFVVGMFLVPRFVKSVSRHGNDEMLTVLATGLCLVLVALAASFHYSAALGAFIMGSILAESAEAKRIEHLVAPLKDIFGAVFFVSVGMLLDPRVILEEWAAVMLISVVIIGGKLTSVTIGALLTGQPLKTAVQTGFSMAQIGEFSFIIASLGMGFGVISEKLYPLIVAASLVTTFTTPYLVKAADPAARFLERKLPARTKRKLENYVQWVQQRGVSKPGDKPVVKRVLAWSAGGLVVLVGLVGLDVYVPTPVTIAVTGAVVAIIVAIFRKSLTQYGSWVLKEFRSGFEADLGPSGPAVHERLAPWDAHLVEVMVPARSFLVGKTLIEAGLRETYGLNVVVIMRSGESIVAPKATERIYPGDGLLCFATDAEIERFKTALGPVSGGPVGDMDDYDLRRLEVGGSSALIGRKIRASGIRETHDCIVVGLEREGRRIPSPSSETNLQAGDVLWVVGEGRKIDALVSAQQA